MLPHEKQAFDTLHITHTHTNAQYLDTKIDMGKAVRKKKLGNNSTVWHFFGNIVPVIINERQYQ